MAVRCHLLIKGLQHWIFNTLCLSFLWLQNLITPPIWLHAEAEPAKSTMWNSRRCSHYCGRGVTEGNAISPDRVYNAGSPTPSVLCPVFCALCPVSCVLCPLSSVLCPVFYVLCPVSSVLFRVSSVMCPGSCVVCPLSCVLVLFPVSYIMYPVS